MVFERRASTILFNILCTNCHADTPFVLPTNICSDVYFTFLKAEVPVVFEDIERANLGLDIEKVSRRAEGQAIQGILYNHTYGNEFTPLQAVRDLKIRHPGMLAFDDRCLCAPVFEPNQAHLDVFDLVLFSTGYAKVLELNHGGFAYRAPRLPYEPRRLPFHQEEYDALEQCYASATKVSQELTRLACGSWLLTDAPKEPAGDYRNKVESLRADAMAHKQELNTVYAQGIDPAAQLGEKYNTWRFQISVEHKEELLEAIFANELFAGGHYESIGTKLGLGEYPVAEELASSVVNLFNDHYFTEAQAEALVQIVSTHTGGNARTRG